MNNSNSKEASQDSNYTTPSSKIDGNLLKTESNTSETALAVPPTLFDESHGNPKEAYTTDGTLALQSHVFEDLPEQTNALMEKTSGKTTNGKPLYSCFVCVYSRKTRLEKCWKYFPE